jgi:ACS family pantothenate transporter-like MFS transporter
MNTFAYIFTAWVPIFTFPTSKQPYIVDGYYITAAFGAAAAILVLVIRHFHNRDLRKQLQSEQGLVSPVESAVLGEALK